MSTAGECAWTARDLVPVLLEAPRGDRAAANRHVRALHRAGYTSIKELVAVTGYSRSYISSLLHDPDGSEDRLRKASYGGLCCDCGSLTTPRNDGTTPDRCAGCHGDHLHATRYWTKDTIAAAFREAHRVLGRPPTAADLSAHYPSYAGKYSATRMAEAAVLRAAITAGLKFPHPGIVCREYGSWNACLDELGMPRARSGGLGHREPRPARPPKQRRRTAKPAPAPLPQRVKPEPEPLQEVQREQHSTHSDHDQADGFKGEGHAVPTPAPAGRVRPNRSEAQYARQRRQRQRNALAEGLPRIAADLATRRTPEPANTAWADQVRRNLADAHERALDTLRQA